MNKRIKKKYIKKRYRGSIMTNEAYQSLITFRNCEQCLKKGCKPARRKNYAGGYRRDIVLTQQILSTPHLASLGLLHDVSTLFYFDRLLRGAKNRHEHLSTLKCASCKWDMIWNIILG